MLVAAADEVGRSRLGLNLGGSHPWDSAYHGLHDRHRSAAAFGVRARRADPSRMRAGGWHGTRGGATLIQTPAEAFPTLWGMPWDGSSRERSLPERTRAAFGRAYTVGLDAGDMRGN